MYNMQRLSSVYTMVPDGHFFVAGLTHTNVKVENRLNSDVTSTKNEINSGKKMYKKKLKRTKEIKYTQKHSFYAIEFCSTRVIVNDFY